MTLPLIALAIPAATLGFTGAIIAEHLGHEAEALNLPVASASLLIAITGIATGWLAYGRGAESEAAMEKRMGGVWTTLRAAYGFDAAVNAVVVRPVTAISNWLYGFLDRKVIDGAAEGVPVVVRFVGQALSAVQTGDGQWYASIMGAGAVLLIALLLGSKQGLMIGAAVIGVAAVGAIAYRAVRR